MSAQEIYEFVEGDTLPEPTYQIANLAEFKFVHFDVIREDGVRLPRKTVDVVTPGSSISAVIDDEVEGIFRFLWLADELIAGHHTARIVLVRLTDDKEESLPKGLPILLRVTPKEG